MGFFWLEFLYTAQRKAWYIPASPERNTFHERTAGAIMLLTLERNESDPARLALQAVYYRFSGKEQE